MLTDNFYPKTTCKKSKLFQHLTSLKVVQTPTNNSIVSKDFPVSLPSFFIRFIDTFCETMSSQWVSVGVTCGNRIVNFISNSRLIIWSGNGIFFVTSPRCCCCASSINFSRWKCWHHQKVISQKVLWDTKKFFVSNAPSKKLPQVSVHWTFAHSRNSAH